jgi:Tfp pilus assembly protein PilX
LAVTGRAQRGTTLAVGIILLALVTLLGLAGASTAHVERQLAQNELFRENATSAASAGIEVAISAIVTSPTPDAASTAASDRMPDSPDRFETLTRFAGYELTLPQAPGAHLAGAHFEILSTGYATRHAIERQRAAVMLVVDAPAAIAAADCEPLSSAHCYQLGELERLSWQRVPVE